MEQEYRIGIVYKIAYSILGCCFLIFVSIKSTSSFGHYFGVIFVLSIWAVVWMFNISRKITLTDTHISLKRGFKTRELASDAVKGFKIVGDAIIIEPIDRSNTTIRINDYTSIGDYKGLLENMRKVYVDIDAISYQDNLNTILSDDKLRGREEDKLSKYNLSKRMTLVYNCCGSAIFVLFLIFTNFIFSNSGILAILAWYPVIGFVLLVWGQGLIKVITTKNSAFSNIVVGLFLSIIILLVTTAISYKIVAYRNMFLWVMIFGSMILSFLYRFGYDRSENCVKGQFVLLAIMSLFYAWPVTLIINSKLDNSTPVAYEATVLDKYIYHNNNRNYYHFKLSQWNNDIVRPVDLQIDGGFYKKIQRGQNVHVNVKKGLLNIPWYYIKD